MIKTNEFTSGFQEIVNTYGIPNYKEVNPTVFTIVTFPFLFGIMFGDLGHGLVLFSVGSFLCVFSAPLRRKVPAIEALLGIRYLILMMGLFATYCGFLYNDFMAMPIFWKWDSCYDLKSP
jgi:V-type H+-transporting ATPase subunit a